MSIENVQLTDIRELRNKIESLLKEANKTTDCFEQTQKDFEVLKTQLNDFKNVQDEYAKAFAYLCRVFSNPNDFDRNVPLDDKNALLSFSKDIMDLSTKLQEDKKHLQVERNQLTAEQEKFELDKSDRQKLYAAWKQQDSARIEAENAPLRKQIDDKRVELDKLTKEVDVTKEELETLKSEIEVTGKASAYSTIDCNTRPTTEVAVLKDFTDAGYTAPEDAIPGHLYLCGEFGYVDVTVMPNVNRVQLQQIDNEKFKYTGKPQISFARLPSGDWVVRPQLNLVNKVNGKELTEEIPLPQGAVIEMTDKHKETHLVKAFIAL